MRIERVVAVGGPRISRVILLCLALLPSAGHAQLLSSATRNLETLNLALVETVSMFEQPFGLTPSTLTYSGGFTEVGWNALLGGSYGGMPVALSYAATYDPTLLQGSWTVGGMVGATAWNGMGTWTFTVLAANQDATDGDIVVPLPFFFIDRHYRVFDVVTANQKLDVGETRWTLNGFTVRTSLRTLSDWVILPDRPGQATVTTSLPDEGIAQAGTANFTLGTTSGTITVSAVPEPMTVTLLGVGLLGLAGARRTRGPRKTRATSA